MNVIKTTEQWVKEQFLHEATGHDWYHIVRVTNLAEEIGEQEEADLFVAKMAALLHDLADDKVSENEQKAIDNIHRWLEYHNVNRTNIVHIIEIIKQFHLKEVTVISYAH